jgi:RING finger/CCCH-type zinc finger protein
MSATVRTFPLLNKVGVNSTVTTTAGNVISVIGSTETTGKIVASTNGISNTESSVSQLIPRGTDSAVRTLETVKKVGKVGTNAQNAGPSAESVSEK